jgi:hypothetical protein
MSPLDALWHLLNFIAPAIAVATIASALAKLSWRRELVSVPWTRLVLWAAGAGVLALMGGLMAFGRDGKMATYAALVAACALALWWVGFARR